MSNKAVIWRVFTLVSQKVLVIHLKRLFPTDTLHLACTRCCENVVCWSSSAQFNFGCGEHKEEFYLLTDPLMLTPAHDIHPHIHKDNLHDAKTYFYHSLNHINYLH